MFILSQKEEGGKERFSEDSKNSTHFQGYSINTFQEKTKQGRKPAGGKKEKSRERTVFLRNVRENNFDIVRVGEYDRERRKCTKKIE